MPSIKKFIRHWKFTGSSELGDFQSFIIGLCQEYELPSPDGHRPDDDENGYVFEKSVPMLKDGRTTKGRADAYRARCVVIEGKGFSPQLTPEQRHKPSVKTGLPVRESPTWYIRIADAKNQAEVYARTLSAIDGHIPFIIVVDVGYTLHLYADFQGRGIYAPFPSARENRFYLEDLEKPEVREMIRAIWLAPMSLDPTRKAERVTTEIARDLSKLTASLVQSGHAPDVVAFFTMRSIFCLFAEDITLLPHGSFTQLLERYRDDPEALSLQLSLLWQTMKNGGYLPAIDAELPQIGGHFFDDVRTLPLTHEQVDMLLTAARANWAEVQPSIFGTLLEQALSPPDRYRMGAHFTPPVYVERLAVPTFVNVLRRQWRRVANTASQFVDANDYDRAIKVIQDFHEELCNVEINDLSCGSGNILVVCFSLLKDLEDEVLQALHDLGIQTYVYRNQRTVSPAQMRGIEMNINAVAISELVLAIAQLQRHYSTYNMVRPFTPTLYDGDTIRHGDAILAHDGIVDGVYINPRPATGLIEPRPGKRIFIVGNLPFKGTGRKKNEAFGEEYMKAIYKAYPHIPKTANICMIWWDTAADLIARGIVEQAGVITPNTIRQISNRSVIKRRLEADKPVSIVFAIPDHPWKSAEFEASVRIAMTVIAKGNLPGVLAEVVEESEDEDVYAIYTEDREGFINANLSLGVDTTITSALQANVGVASHGVLLNGTRFTITPEEAVELGLGRIKGLDQYIKPYRNGRDVTGVPRNRMVIDLYGLDITDVESRFPEVYSYLCSNVKPARDRNKNKRLTRDWWVFANNKPELRKSLVGLSRYIVTSETAKHRIFTFLDAEILPDHKLVVFALEDSFHLGVLSSTVHGTWASNNGGKLVADNSYVKTECFDNFPFPAASEEQRQAIRVIAEELDAHRKQALADNPGLTMTEIYNLIEKYRGAIPLTDVEKATFDTADLARVTELHSALDAAVFVAYGWPNNLTRLQILSHLTNLNQLRIQEEQAGRIRWLRPERQQE